MLAAVDYAGGGVVFAVQMTGGDGVDGVEKGWIFAGAFGEEEFEGAAGVAGVKLMMLDTGSCWSHVCTHPVGEIVDKVFQETSFLDGNAIVL